MTTRQASHAGSWYSSSSAKLSSELEQWLDQVPSSVGDGDVPISGARVIIAPHAGYSYAGPTAAWAYKCLDLSKAKRIFLLGPSHAIYLPGCALSKHARYATPLGDLVIDTTVVDELQATGKFDKMSTTDDETEHSLEMHVPYIYKMLSKNFKSADEFPLLIPILVGSTKSEKEKSYGKLLAPYLADPSNVFVISSDFCHWGSRFQYTYYVPSSSKNGVNGAYNLKKRDKDPTDPPIHESIKMVDRMAMDAVESGKHSEFLNNLKQTGNTVCGRHPIGVVMAAIESLKEEGKLEEDKGIFKFVRYERSGEVEEVSDSSVSYASAYAVL